MGDVQGLHDLPTDVAGTENTVPHPESSRRDAGKLSLGWEFCQRRFQSDSSYLKLSYLKQ